ncbi:MAG: thrombospondin type 3 repeat-containing protein [Gemmatimonadaceae bacterium]|nr:thrombospondin type 3 repeat-containing protein [Gemmatimonadaceae bacterium]
MKATNFVLAAAMLVGGCSDGDEDVSESQQHVVGPYTAVSDATTGGTAGFFIFTPYGNTPEAGPFPGTFFNFGTIRVKVNVLNLTSCSPTGPAEGTLVATLGVQVSTKYQMSRNITKIGTGLVTGNCYRIKPTLDGFSLGFTDVQVTSGTATAPFHRVTPGSNLTVGFRTESTLNDDGDADTVPDYRDNCATTPNTDQADSDADGIGDACEVVDNDGDGIADNVDNCPGTPNTDQADTDADGIGDACDVCPLDNPNDADADGTPSCQETCPADPNKLAPGQCGCGIADTDTDSDGTADCNDACDNDPFKTGSGGCGCNSIDVDTDGNGTVDTCATTADRCGPPV